MESGLEKLLKLYEELDPALQSLARQALLRKTTNVNPQTQDLGAEKTSKLQNVQRAEAPSEEFLRYLSDVRAALKAYRLRDLYQPGDENRLNLVREEMLRAMEPFEWLMKSYFRYEVKGLENIPRQGACMLISNHGVLPIDGWFLFYEIWRRTGRWPRGLTDWRIYKFPLLRQFFMDMGMVVGSPENADGLLANDELVFIMPGGSKEAWKSSRFRYRLLWQGRYGFVRAALRNQCPIIPSANVGTDDTYWLLFDGYTTAYKLFRSKKVLLPVTVPIGLGPLPLPVKMTQYVGEPIRLPYPPEAENDPVIVRECQDLVKSRLYELIDLGLRERQEKHLERVDSRE